MKILHLDIETAPNLAHVWGLWKQNVALNQIVATGYVLSWAAKWDRTKPVHFARVEHGPDGTVTRASRHDMLARVHELLSEADAVVSYNGYTFDIPWLNAEFVQAGFTPPPPFKQIDLLQEVKKRFRFPSYKLEHVAKALGVGSKVKHEGHGLWVRCMAGNLAAWQRMGRYNRGDVLLQERVYHKVRPWVKNHPIHALHTEDSRPRCPNCGGEQLQRRGTALTRVQRYARYQCLGCGAWSRNALQEKAAKVQRVPVL